MIRLLVDSSADYSSEELKTNNIMMVPLQISINDNNYRDGIDIFKDEFYHKLVNENANFKTSQPSPNEYLKYFKEAKDNDDIIICILLSSALSGTYQSAILAKNIVEYEKIYIIDSLTATAAIRILCDEALKMINENIDINQIIKHLEELKKHIKILAAVDTLEYLLKGGRISKTTATIGEMVNIKPIITVDNDGKVQIAGKKIGINKTISFIVDKMISMKPNLKYPVYSLFTYGNENVLKLENKLISKDYKVNDRLQIGPTIGTHIGPEAYGVVFVEEY